MGPTILCYVLSTLTLSYGAYNVYEDGLRTLVQTLSKQGTKYEPNFKHTGNYQETNPESNKRTEERVLAANNNKVTSALQAFNMLLGMPDTGKVPSKMLHDEMWPKPKLRMCRKKPKEIKCSYTQCTTEKPPGDVDDECEGYYYDDEKFKRQRKPNIHNDIDEIIGLLIKVDTKISEYEQLAAKNFRRDIAGEPISCSGDKCDRIDRHGNVKHCTCT